MHIGRRADGRSADSADDGIEAGAGRKSGRVGPGSHMGVYVCAARVPG